MLGKDLLEEAKVQDVQMRDISISKDSSQDSQNLHQVRRNIQLSQNISEESQSLSNHESEPDQIQPSVQCC